MNGILAIDLVYKLKHFLAGLVEENVIRKFKIVLQLNMRIEVHILIDDAKGKKWYIEKFGLTESATAVKFIEYENYEDEQTKREQALVFNCEVDFSLRRRLTNFIKASEIEIPKPCPIITFYSYKGGTGRTTALAFFASWLATHFAKKVVIIDCDFEAPGLTNYFDISEDKKGIAEYLLDVDFAALTGSKLDIRKDYAHQVRYEYVGKGDIFIVPAGNLSNVTIDDNDPRDFRTDYLEAIARIDISSTSQMVKKLQLFFADLAQQLELDSENSVILIDSRTGFTDTFAVLSSISDIIIGFFGVNRQSFVGLSHFLDTFGSVENSGNRQIVLVNSISENLAHFQSFKSYVNNYIQTNEERFSDEVLGLRNFVNKIFRIPRTEFLSRIGSELEEADKGSLEQNLDKSDQLLNLQFHTKVQRPDSEFEDFFNELRNQIDAKGSNDTDSDLDLDLYNEDGESTELTTGADEITTMRPEVQNPARIDDRFFNYISNVDIVGLREQLLRTIIEEDNFPKPYADTGSQKPKKDEFFFRDSMKDLFNRDKYVIIGYKGTGKTHIYRSLENREISDTLCIRERQNPANYIFVNVIPIGDDERYFSAEDGFMESEKRSLGLDYFFRTFWLIYSWSSLFKNQDVQKLGIIPSMPIFDLNDNTVPNILEIIRDRSKVTSINNDIEKINAILKQTGKTVILSYDQIDFVIKPQNWNDGVAPLINYWRSNVFSNIWPKIFVRADIFENRLTNITNFNEIQKEKSISLQWSKEELFAYFFKYIFRVSKSKFYALSYALKNYSPEAQKTLLEVENELDKDGQLSVSKQDKLKFLVECFFGKYADRYNNKNKNVFGENYDWFYKNLTDAKNAISIRPFLDLLSKAIQMALTRESLSDFRKHKHNQKQVLSAYYFTSNEAKAYAAERYYTDLSKDKGNEPLRFFYQYIKHDGLERFRIYEFTREQLDDLLKRIIDFPNYKHESVLQGISIDDFKNQLINNGVLAVKYRYSSVRKFTRYIIPFLYRSYFSVSKPSIPITR